MKRQLSPFTPPRFGVWTLDAGVVLVVAADAASAARELRRVQAEHAIAVLPDDGIDGFADDLAALARARRKEGRATALMKRPEPLAPIDWQRAIALSKAIVEDQPGAELLQAELNAEVLRTFGGPADKPGTRSVAIEGLLPDWSPATETIAIVDPVEPVEPVVEPAVKPKRERKKKTT